MTLICVALWVNPLWSEELIENLTMTSFIKTAEQDYILQNQDELNDYMDHAPESTPYIDRVELRTKTEDFDIENKQKYSMRFVPKGWGETTYTRQLTETIRASGKTDSDICYNSALKQRYDLVIDYLETADLLDLKNKLIILCDDRINVLKKKSAGAISFDIRDLIDAEECLIKLRLELVKLENKKTGIVHKIGVAANSGAPIVFNNENLISVNEIHQTFEQVSGLDMGPVQLKSRKDKVDIALNKYNLEKAKTRDYLSYFQVSYDTSESDDPKKAYSIEFGIKLPFFNSDREAVNLKKMNYMQERLKYEEDKRDGIEKMMTLKDSLDRMICQHALLIENMEIGNARSSYNVYLKMEGMDPLNILSIKESILKSDIQRIETGYDVRRRFIELLFMTGKLSEKPFKNYLASHTENAP